jgi:hypothetical protein
MAKIKLIVERETYEKNDKTYYSYFVRGNIRGKEVKALLSPPDVGGYNVLDIVFGDSDKAELIVTPFEIKDDATKRVITGNSYEIMATDPDGEVFKCAIKPFRKSDKSLLNMLLR